MKKYIIFVLLLFSLYSCGNTNIISSTKNSKINIEKKEKDIFSEIKEKKEGDKIIISGKTNGEIDKIEILWKNGSQNDSYFLKKFKKGDKQWLTNLKIDYGNLLDGNNEYTIKLYKNNKVYKENVKIINYKFNCNLTLNDEIRGKKYEIITKNTYNCREYDDGFYFDFVGLKGIGGKIRARTKEENNIYIEDSSREKQLEETQKDIDNGAFNSHAVYYHINGLNNENCKNKKYCYFSRGLGGFGTKIWIHIVLDDIMIEFIDEGMEKNFKKFNKDYKNFSLLKESFEKMEIKEIAKLDIKNITLKDINASKVENKWSEKYFLLKDSKNGVKKRVYYNLSSCIEEYGENFSQAEILNFGYCSINSFKNGKIYWSTEFTSHGISINKYYSTDLKGNTELEKEEQINYN